MWVCAACYENNSNNNGRCCKCQALKPHAVEDRRMGDSDDPKEISGLAENTVIQNVPGSKTETPKFTGVNPLTKPSRQEIESAEAVGHKDSGVAGRQHGSQMESHGLLTEPHRQGIDEKELRLVLIGMTGAGKSATGNTILNKNYFKSKLSQTSVTVKCEYFREERFDKTVLLVDTPGLLDTKFEKGIINKEIKKCIGISSPGPHAFILVTSMLHRFTDEAAMVFNELDDMFGENLKKYLIVAFTGKENLETSFKEYTDTSPPKLKEILSSAGGGCIAFNNKGNEEEKEKDVQDLLQKVEDMVTKNQERHFTSKMFEEAERLMQKRIENELRDKTKREKIQQDLKQAEKRMHMELEYYKQLSEKKDAQLQDLESTMKKNSKKNFFSKSEKELEQLVRQEMEKIQLKNKFLKQCQDLHGDEKAQLNRKIGSLGREISKIVQDKKRVEEKVTDEVLSLMIREDERKMIEQEDKGAIQRLLSTLTSGGIRFLNFFK